MTRWRTFSQCNSLYINFKLLKYILSIIGRIEELNICEMHIQYLILRKRQYLRHDITCLLPECISDLNIESICQNKTCTSEDSKDFCYIIYHNICYFYYFHWTRNLPTWIYKTGLDINSSPVVWDKKKFDSDANECCMFHVWWNKWTKYKNAKKNS